jgi:hypothetical protein
MSRALEILRRVEWGHPDSAFMTKHRPGSWRECPCCRAEVMEDVASTAPVMGHAVRHRPGCELAAELDAAKLFQDPLELLAKSAAEVELLREQLAAARAGGHVLRADQGCARHRDGGDPKAECRCRGIILGTCRLCGAKRVGKGGACPSEDGPVTSTFSIMHRDAEVLVSGHVAPVRWFAEVRAELARRIPCSGIQKHNVTIGAFVVQGPDHEDWTSLIFEEGAGEDLPPSAFVDEIERRLKPKEGA